MKYFAIIACAALAACGPSPEDELASLQSRAIAADQMAEDLALLSTTSKGSMPTTGSAQFNGYSAVIIDPVLGLDVDDILLLGDATIHVTFAGGGTVTGTADNFGGIVGSGAVSQIATTSGSIDIGNSSSGIGQGVPANEWNADYEGTVIVNGTSYTLTGTLDGLFLGNAVNKPAPETFIKGIVGNDLDGFAVTGTGGIAPLGFEIIGTNPLWLVHANGIVHSGPWGNLRPFCLIA